MAQIYQDLIVIGRKFEKSLLFIIITANLN